MVNADEAHDCMSLRSLSIVTLLLCRGKMTIFVLFNPEGCIVPWDWKLYGWFVLTIWLLFLPGELPEQQKRRMLYIEVL